MANGARGIMDMPQGKHNWRIAAILVSIVKSEEKVSYGELVKHFGKHPYDLQRYELLRPYSK